MKTLYNIVESLLDDQDEIIDNATKTAAPAVARIMNFNKVSEQALSLVRNMADKQHLPYREYNHEQEYGKELYDMIYCSGRPEKVEVDENYVTITFNGPDAIREFINTLVKEMSKLMDKLAKKYPELEIEPGCRITNMSVLRNGHVSFSMKNWCAMAYPNDRNVPMQLFAADYSYGIRRPQWTVEFHSRKCKI